ncbi:MAG: hypothetical protein V4662_05525 [Verrucomicrobiota bacterium]
MLEIEIYAPGLRQESRLMEFCSQMDMQPQVRYKVDTNHDLVYFEIDDPAGVTLDQLTECFTAIGLAPRIVGQLPEGLGTTTAEA